MHSQSRTRNRLSSPSGRGKKSEKPCPPKPLGEGRVAFQISGEGNNEKNPLPKREGVKTRTKSKVKSYKFGIIAEYIVITILTLSGHKIIARRMKTAFGEIDIIASKGNNLTFVEVKARKDHSNVEVVSSRQMERIVNAASLFIAKRPELANFNMRFDLVLVSPWRWPEFIKDAWQSR